MRGTGVVVADTGCAGGGHTHAGCQVPWRPACIARAITVEILPDTSARGWPARRGSAEQTEAVDSSMTVDITDTGAAGAQAAGPGLLPRADQAACVRAAAHAGYAPSRRRRRGR